VALKPPESIVQGAGSEKATRTWKSTYGELIGKNDGAQQLGWRAERAGLLQGREEHIHPASVE